MNTPVHPLVRYAWYGDDFTGSTDVLDALGRAGVSSVLFLRRPQPQQLTPFFPCTAIGLAGESRSRNPEWMDAHLPGAFEFLRSLQPQVCHYKVCSTFDSAPHIGSIGRALEIGQDLFGTPVVPIVGFAPHLGRYLLFGNLFAASHGEAYRIDRHPVMSCHPVTPMHEADLRLHLARQTTRPIALADLIALRSLEPGQLLSKIKATKNAAVLFDGFDETDLLRTGRVLVGARSRTNQSSPSAVPVLPTRCLPDGANADSSAPLLKPRGRLRWTEFWSSPAAALRSPIVRFSMRKQ